MAYRLARKAREGDLRRRAREARLPGTPPPGPEREASWREVQAALDEELERLPEKYRAPLVLCCLEGQARDEAAAQLGLPLSTLRGRLERGRDLLRARLARRGVALSAALLVPALAGGGAATAVAAPLLVAAVRSALRPAGGPMVPVAPTEGVLKAMSPAKLKITTAVLVVACTAGAGALLVTHRTLAPGQHGAQAEGPPSPPPAQPRADDPAQTARVFELVAEAVEACEPSWQPRLLTERAVLEAKRGNVAAAKKLFQQAADRGTPATTDYQRGTGLVRKAYVVADAGDRVAAASLLAQARSLAPVIPRKNDSNDVLHFAAVCHAETIDPAEALPFARAIPGENTRLNALNNVAAEQAKAGDVAGALRTVELVRTPHGYFKLKAWEAIAAAQLKAGDRAGAEATLAKALAALEQVRIRLQANGQENWREDQVQVLARYAAAQGRAGDHDGARATLGRAEQVIAGYRRAAPSRVLVTLALGQAEAGERAAAARTVQRFLMAVEAYEPEGAAAAIIPALIVLKDYDRAAALAGRAPAAEALRPVCEALAEDGNTEKAVALARAAKAAEARAWGLIGAARGALNRVPPERRPRYSGTFSRNLPSRPSAAPQPSPPASKDPVYEYQDAVEQFEKSLAEFGKRRKEARTEEERKSLEKERPRADECARRLLKLAREHPGSWDAVRALEWVVTFARSTPLEEQALMLARQENVAAKNVGGICGRVTSSVHLDAAERLLRAVLEKSPHRAARGGACLALAGFLRRKAVLTRNVQREGRPDDLRRFEQTFGPAEVKRLRAGDPARLEAEAERLYERAVAEFGDISPPGLDGPLGKWAKAALFEMRELAVGKTAPEIEGEDLDGKALRLSDHRGKVVVLTFWATWCAPCRAMVPHERELVQRLKGRPFVLLGVNGDGDRARLAKWLADNPLPWRSWQDGRQDGQGRIARAWNVSAWPTVYVLDHRGVIRHRDVFGKGLDEAVDALLKEVPAGLR